MSLLIKYNKIFFTRKNYNEKKKNPDLCLIRRKYYEKNIFIKVTR